MTETLYRLVDDLDRMTAIDFFGGSGLLSQWCLEAGFKHVVWNDFDDYQGRIRYYMTDRYRNYISWARDYLYEELKIENGFEESSVYHLLLCGVGFTRKTFAADPRKIPKRRIYSNIPKGGHWRTDGVRRQNGSAATIWNY